MRPTGSSNGRLNGDWLGRSPKVMARLCVDEKGMGHGHDYLTIVAQAEEGQTTVQYVGEGREQESLDAFWEGLMAEQLAGVEAIAMDMWKPYVQSTLAHVPGAAGKIVHDPFHLVKYMNEAVNEVRKSEHRRLQAQGDDILKSTRQLWLYGMENVPAKHAQRFDADQGTQLGDLTGVGDQGSVSELLAVRHGEEGRAVFRPMV